MQQSNRTVIGVFDEGAMADQAVAALESAGFSSAQIHRHGHQASSGGFLSGLKNLFGGDANRDTTAADDFSDLGVSGDEATYYDNESQAGRHIVSVRADGRAEEAMTILRTNGAYNYGTRSGGTGIVGGAASNVVNTTQTNTAYNNTTVDPTRTGAAYDNTVADPTRTGAAYDNTVADPTRTGAAYDNTLTDEARRLQLREEQLNVSKQRVQTGEVGIHKDVISEEKVINVPVTHEEVFIERTPVTGATVTDTTPIGEGEVIRVPLTEEQVNVSKSTVVTGEVEIGKRAVTENQRVTDTVRREEARLDRQGDVHVSGTANDPLLNDTTTNSTIDNRTDRTDDRTI